MKSVKIVLASAAFIFSATAFASGAVEYTCAGFVPSTAEDGTLSSEALGFSMTSANGGIILTIESRSKGSVDVANADLTVGNDCRFSMVPNKIYPAYDVSVSGKCGTKVKHNFKGTCFFNN
jgi:hypothetical protein